ncbi:class I SAM-dependent methyltransferase [Alloalcanivorax gelatiniphagus]
MTGGTRPSTPSWVQGFYDRKSRAAGPSGVLEHHEERAQTLARLAGPARRSVLELGAGAGGSAVATARLGYRVTAAELSSVRAGFARELAGSAGVELEVVEHDFMTFGFRTRYDVVAMWNGFGVGDDDYQRAVLGRAASVWLAPDGLMILDVFNPAAYARWAGHDDIDEETGCREAVDFDVVSSRFIDSWWFDGPGAAPLSQSVRCYSPADLQLLVEGTGLSVVTSEWGDHREPFPCSAAGAAGEEWGYRVVLAPDS